MKKRIYWIDITRAIAMVMIITGHTLGIYTFSTFAKILFAVHVPVFFVLSGYLFSEKNWKILFGKLNRNLLLPYLAVCFIMTATTWITIHHHIPFIFASVQTHELIIASLYGIGTNTVIPYFNQQILAIGAIWFLVAMYIGDILFNLSFKIADKFRKSILIIVLISFIECILGFVLATQIHFILPWSLTAALISQAFYCGGYLIKRFNLMQRSFIYLFSGIALWGISVYTGFFYLNTGYATNPFWAILGGVGGSFVIMKVSQYIEFALSNTHYILKSIQVFGQLSLVVLCAHIFDLKLLGFAGAIHNVVRFKFSELVSVGAAIGYRILFVSVVVLLIPKVPFIRSFFLNRQYPFNFKHGNKKSCS